MIHKSIRKSLALGVLVSMTLLLCSCDQIKSITSGDGKVEVPSMAQGAEAMELTRDDKGLSDIDRQYLAYGKEKWDQYYKAVEDFGQTMNKDQSFLTQMREYAVDIKGEKDYQQVRTDLMSAAQRFEKVDPAQIPQSFQDFYDKLYTVANRARHFIYRVEEMNATNLPDDFTDFQSELAPYKEQIEKFISAVESDGLDAAAGSIPATDWGQEDTRHVELRDTFNVADLGLKWGSSQWDVMGVEGLKKDGYNAELLSYPNHVYQYDTVRNYHFNEFGQLDYYTYDIDGDSFNRGIYSQTDPLFDDIKEISSIVMYYFVTDQPAIPAEPAGDGAGNYTVQYDMPAETVLLEGRADGTITLTVTGKTTDEVAE